MNLVHLGDPANQLNFADELNRMFLPCAYADLVTFATAMAVGAVNRLIGARGRR